jgi:two-component system nitrate/nitrite response regulator NarL
MESRTIRVGILEDQQVFLESMAALLESAGMEVVARASSVEEFLARTQQRPPDVALVDLRLERADESVDSGFRAVELLHDFHPNVRSLVLSGNRDSDTVSRCFMAGASGYLCKMNVGCEAVVEAVTRVARGERLVPPELFSSALPSSAGERPATGVLSRLTAREREVLGYIASGADNLKIAVCLGITERTVKAHITSIYRKLDVENRTQMAMLACQLGLERPLTV